MPIQQGGQDRTAAVESTTRRIAGGLAVVAVKKVFRNGGRGDDLHVVNGAESVDLRTLLVINDSVVGAEFATTLPAGNLLVWVVPFVGLGAGLVLVVIVLRRWSRKSATVASTPVDPAMRERIRREMSRSGKP